MRRWLSFQGRASRGEYWGLSCLAVIVFFCTALFLDIVMGFGVPLLVGHSGFAAGVADLLALALLLLDMVWYIWVLLAVSVRRLHDLGYTGRAGFRSFRISLQASYLRGTAGPNAFGPDPLA